MEPLEPEIDQFTETSNSDQIAALVSIAISLKRIADLMKLTRDESVLDF